MSGADTETSFVPLVKAATTSQSPNVRSVMDEWDDGMIVIPDYQRDSSQWDLEKKSRFIESLINGLTVPPLLVYPEDDPKTGLEKRQIVDGQQRVTTIREFMKDAWALGTDEDVEYAPNVRALVAGKKFSELDPTIRRQIEKYTLNLIILPKNIDLTLRLEIFRRINEAGVPLSAHDLRLATFGDCDRVQLVRLAGIFDLGREGSKRMIDAAKKHGVDYPWVHPDAWTSWWAGTASSVGQAASQMFLYYAIARDPARVHVLLSDPERIQQTLAIRFDGTITTVLDIWCAQGQHESKKPEETAMIADRKTLEAWFLDFEKWFFALKTWKVPRMSVASSTKVALFIAAASMAWRGPELVTPTQWEDIEVFLTQTPTRIKQLLGIEYPLAKGRWTELKKQIDRTFEICRAIAHK
jgi:hypothetical protein